MKLILWIGQYGISYKLKIDSSCLPATFRHGLERSCREESNEQYAWLYTLYGRRSISR